MANYALCITASKGGGSFPVFRFKAQSGTPTTPITINSIYSDGYAVGSPCVTAVSSMFSLAGTSFTPTTFDYSLTPATITGTWSSVNFVTIYNLIINGTSITSNGFLLTNGPDTITIYFAECLSENTYYCISPTPENTSTPTMTPSQSPTNTPTYSQTPTNTPTYTQTPTNTPTTSFTPTPTTTFGTTPTNTETPTNTPTLTPTKTPTQTPEPTKVFTLANDCNVFTLFPLGIECVTLSELSSSNSYDGILSLKITGGTSPYSISWSNGQKTKTIGGLSKGSYEAQVIDYYGDYTATTICSLFGPTPSMTPTNTNTPTMTPSGTYPNLCLSILTCPSITPIQFNPSTSQNTKPTWISTSGYLVIWNLTLQQWEIQNYTVFGGKLVSKTTQTPPLSGWFVQGGTSNPKVAMTTGSCPSTPPLNVTVQKTDSDCTNNGSISLTTCGGSAPYQYSINGGTTFTTSNVFNNLSPQTYNIIAKDSMGNTSTDTVVISNTSAGITTYTLSVSNYNTQTINVGYKKSSWVVNVTPPIPQGTTISFSLNIDTTQINNGPGSGTTISQNNVFSGGTIISPNTTNSSSSTSTRVNCSPEITTTTIINDVYNITIGYGDVISGTSFSTLNITSGVTSLNGCVTNLVQDIKVFANAGTTQGCSCCTVETDSLARGGVENHQLSLGQGQTSQIYYNFVIGLGNTQSSACTDFYTNPNRKINSPTFGPGVFVYGGSPNNPTVITGYSFVTYNTYIYNMNPTTGQVGQPVMQGQLPAQCF